MKRILIKLQKNKKAYFAGDFHLGKPSSSISLQRELKIVNWLDYIKKDAQELFLMGDIFDFWFEYKDVRPKENLLFINKISELIKLNINIHYFKGNHDLWMLDFFKNMGIKLYDDPHLFILNNKKLLVGHGDGLGKGDYGYKLLKIIFISKLCQYLYRLIPSKIGIKIGKIWSGSHREVKRDYNSKKNNDRLINYCKNFEKKNQNDVYIFGHSHHKSKVKINNNSMYYNAGEWMVGSSYLMFSNDQFKLKKFNNLS